MNRNRLYICVTGFLIAAAALVWWGAKEGQNKSVAPVAIAGKNHDSKISAASKIASAPIAQSNDYQPPAAGAVKVPAAPGGAPEGVRAFRDWAQKFFDADPSARAKMMKEGRELAKKESEAIKVLIPNDPEKAIANAVPMVVRQDLPPEIVGLLEKRVNTVGSLLVLGSALGEGATGAPISRIFTPKGGTPDDTAAAYTFGNRLREHSLNETAINGVQVGGELALTPQRVRQLEPGERLNPNKKVIEVCPVSGVQTPVASVPSTTVNGTSTVVDAPDYHVTLCAGGHIIRYNQQLANQEASSPANRLKTMAEGSAGGGQTPFDVPVGWSTGTSTMLYIRIAFPDIMQAPRSETDAYDVVRQVTDFYATSSFGRFYLVPTVSPLVVLPYPERWYIDAVNSSGKHNGYAWLRAHAEEAARRLGYDTNGYDLEVLDYKGGPNTTESSSGWSGLGAVGGKGVWLYSLSSTSVLGVLAHECGHNLGLSHSNRWLTSSSVPTSIGPGQNEEYGNKFDVMGGSGSALGHFVAVHKWFINWLSDVQIHDVQASGTYRLYQVDQGKADADKRYALHVNKDSERDYWVEFRQNHTTMPNMMNGVMITWSPWGNDSQAGATNGSNGGAQLIDTTPGSVPQYNVSTTGTSDSRDDAALSIGRTFSDTDSNVYITPVAKFTTVPPSIDVVVNRGPFPGNHAPNLAISAATLTPAQGAATSLTASANDPDGDVLAYAWDFGDGSISYDNKAAQSHTWTTSGNFYVTCTASDMKGMRTTRSIIVTVGFPLNNEYTISGTVRDAGGNPMEGVLVANRAPTNADTQAGAAAFKYAYTDSDGNYVLTNMPAVNTSVLAYHYPDTFSNTAVSTFNPLGANQTGIDFNLNPVINYVTISVDKTEITEGQSAKITISRPATAPDVDLDIQVLDGSSGTARLGVDYDVTVAPSVGNTVGTNPIGQIVEVLVNNSPVGTSRVRLVGTNTAQNVQRNNTITLTVAARTDGIVEGPEFAVLEFPDTLPSMPIYGPRTVKIQIDDADAPTRPVVAVVADDPNATEDGKPAVMRLQRYGSTTNPLTVQLSYSGAAVNGSDFVGPPSVTIPAGSDSVTFNIPAIDDVVSEGTEYATVTVATNAAYVPDQDRDSAQFYITDNEQPLLTIAATIPTTSEATPSAPGKFTITRSAPDISQSLTVNFTLGGSALPGQDYRRIEGIAVIPPYETSVDILVEPIDDDIYEGDQTVICRLSTDDSYGIITPGSATVTIQDNDTPQYSIFTSGNGNGAVSKPATGNATYNLFTVTRGAAGQPADISYTVGGSALPGTGNDYLALSGTVHFAATDTAVSIPVTLNAPTKQGPQVDLILTLVPNSSYRLGFETVAKVFIQDQTTDPTVTVSLDDQTSNYQGVLEPANVLTAVNVVAGGAGYTSAPSVTISSATRGTSTGATATATVSNGSVRSFTITNPGSGFTYADMPLTVTIGAPTGTNPVQATATALITTNRNFYFSRSVVSSSALVVKFKLSGTATPPSGPNTQAAGNDYNLSSLAAFTFANSAGTITIPAGASGAYLTVGVLPDNIAEGTETVIATVDGTSAPYSTTAAGYSSTLYINDSDTYASQIPVNPPVVGFGTAGTTVAEQNASGLGNTVSIPITLTGIPASYPVTLEYYIAGGTATGMGVDYSFTPGKVSFDLNGPTTKNIVLTTTPDKIAEGDETVTIGLMHPVAADLGISLHTVTIVDTAIPEVFTDELTSLPTISAQPRGHVHSNMTGVLGNVIVTNGGTGYTSAPTVVISGGGAMIDATATARVVAGVITSFSVTNSGSGYSTAPTVVITGPGTGAVATANVSGGSVSSISVGSGGTGYGPTVSIAGVGSGAAATATISGGVVTSITVTAQGTGYTSAPPVSLVTANGSGAVLKANISGGKVTSISVTNGGSGYGPQISLIGGGRNGAAATATVNAGTVTGVTINNPGTGFLIPPTITFLGGGGSGATATAVVAPFKPLDGVGQILVVNGGTGYSSGPSISFTGGGGSGAQATAVVNGGAISSIVIDKPGAGYLTAPTVVITSPTGSGAVGTATVVSGVVTGVTMVSNGSGYPSAPIISITGGSGNGAKAVANVSSGAITSITVLDPGSSYTSAPNIGITGGGGNGATAVSALAGTLAWFEWGPTTAMAKTTTKHPIGFGGNAVSFQDVIDTLPSRLAYPGTYYYRAVAKNAYGTERGITRTTRTVSDPAAVTLVNAGHTSSSVTFAGTVNPNRINGLWWFEYGPTTAYGSTTAQTNLNNFTSPQTVTSQITGLADGTLLHYRVVLQTALGITRGNDMSVAAIAQQVAGDLLVNVNAVQPTAGTASWSNQGGLLGGNFAASGTPALVANVLDSGIPGVWFNGITDYYAGPAASTDISGNDSRSIEVWAANAGLAGADELVSLGRDGSLTGVTLAYSNDAAHGAVRHDGSTASDAGYPALPTLAQWHHIVYTYNGSKVAKIYVDGALKVTKNLSGNLATTTDPIVLGSARNAAGVLTGGTLNGYLNAVRVHGGELTAAQVLTNYNIGPAIPVPAVPLVAVKGASGLTASSATINAVVVPRGSTTTAWVEWGTSTNYDNATAPQAAGNGWAKFALAAPLSGLAAGIEYHYHVVAQNSMGTTTSPDQTFTPGAIANAGVLWVDLRATDATAGTANWKNLGALGNFAAVGAPSYVANVQATGIPGVQFNGTADAYESLSKADADFSFHSDRTVEAWVFNPALDQASESVAHFGRRVGTRTSLQLSAGSTNAWVAGTDVSPWSTATPPIAPAAAGWHHLVLVHGGTTGTLTTFVDGTQVASATPASGWNTWDDKVLLGAARDGTGAIVWGADGFSGFVNTLRVHGGALTPSQVLANYLTGPSIPVSFTGVSPLAVTQAADTIGGSSATLHGVVTPGGLVTQAWMEWGPTTSYGNVTPAVTLSTTFASEVINAPIGGLTSAATYYYRVVAKNSAGAAVYGSQMNFVATGNITNLPGATTQAASGVGSGKATLNGIAVPDGQAATAWFEYGPTADLGLKSPVTSITATTVSKTMTAALTGLLPHTTYSFRLVVQNATATVVGSTLTFVSSVNVVPVATAGSVTTKEDTPVVLSLKATDADKDPLTLVVVTPPTKGSLSMGTSLTPTYTPNADYNGSDSFTFAVSDGIAQSNTVTFSITITPVADGPNGVNATVSGNEDSTGITGTLTAVDPDVPPAPVVSFAKLTDPANGTVTVNTTTGAFTYVPAPNFNGTDSFTFTATNTGGTGRPGTISITVNPVPDAPVASNSKVWTPKNTDANGTAVATDADGDTLTYAKLSDPTNGTVTSFVTGTGAWTYKPNNNFIGTDSFTFSATDNSSGTLVSNTATITITVGVATANDATFTGVRDDLLTGTVVATDPNNSALTYHGVTPAQHGKETVNSDGTFRYQPNAGFVGTDTFTYSANNGTADSNPGTVTLIITERPPQWTWMGGVNVAKKPGVYGTKGAFAAGNTPGARTDAASWTDESGNFWLFGGSGFATGTTTGLLNDLWQRNTAGQWGWMGGTNAIGAAGVYGAQGLANAVNTPGARSGALTWTTPGKLWLFGGSGRDSTAAGSGLLNDLWSYDLGTGQWTWLKGSNFINANGAYGTPRVGIPTNSPGARSGSAGWVDGAGKLWLFGGNGRAGTGTVNGNLNDLWTYDPAGKIWTWMSGASTLDSNGVYPALGSATASSMPGARSFATAWTAPGYDSVPAAGSFYLFGGVGRPVTGAASGNLNDLWRYDSFSNTWTWISGGSILNGAGVYGTLEQPLAGNVPGARAGATGWVGSRGQLFLFGGQGSGGAMNDVWSFDRSTSLWTWVKGPSTANGAAVYGVLGVPAPANTPGARRGASPFMDLSGGLWLFGGVNGTNSNNDLWLLDQPQVPVISGLNATANSSSVTVTATVNTFGQTFTPTFTLWSPFAPGSVVTFPGSATPGGAAVAVSHTFSGLSSAYPYVVQIKAANISGTAASKPVIVSTSGASVAPSVSFVSSGTTFPEAGGTAEIEVRLSAPYGQPISVPVSVLNTSTATAALDYVVPPAVLNFAPGQSSALISIPVVSDNVDELNETVVLSLGAPTNPSITLGATTTFTLTITDDEDAPSVPPGQGPASKFAAVGDVTTFTVNALGSNLSYQWRKNGALIAGATSSSYVINPTALTSAGAYSCDVKNSLGTASSGAANLFVVDTTAKTVIGAPNANLSFVVSAQAPAGTSLTYAWNVPASPPRLNWATNSPSFSITGVLSGDAGIYNCVITTSTGLTHSSPNFKLVVPNTAPVLQTIAGNVLPAAVVGLPYSYRILTTADAPTLDGTATPSSYAVAGLPAGLSISTTSGVISGTPKAATTAPASLSITATNAIGTSTPATPTLTVLAFPASATGTFVGTLAANPTTNNLGGRADISITSTGVYTAKLTFVGASYSASGMCSATLNGAGNAVATVSATATFLRTKLPSLTLAFVADAATNTITGTFTDPLLSTAPMNGVRNPWAVGTNPATDYKSAYTLGLNPPPALKGDFETPQGSGFASFNLGDDGKISAAFKTADGQTFTLATVLGPTGQMPVFQPFTTSLGSLLGTPIVDKATGLFTASTLDWTKNAAPTTSKDMAYRQGFGPLSLAVAGGKYSQPAAGLVVQGLDNLDFNAVIGFTGPTLAATDAPKVVFSIRNKTTTGTTQTVTMPAATDTQHLNPDKVTVTLTSSSGNYSGSLTIPNAVATLARKVTFQGVLLNTGSNTYSAPGFGLLPLLPEPGQTLTTSPVLSISVGISKNVVAP